MHSPVTSCWLRRSCRWGRRHSSEYAHPSHAQSTAVAGLSLLRLAAQPHDLDQSPAPSRTLPRPRDRSQVFLSYGALPNLALILQFGFVLPTLPTDFALVHCDELAHADGATTAAAGAAADAGLLMREAGGGISAWQPAGPQLRAALLEMAEQRALPPSLVSGAGAGEDAEGGSAARRRWQQYQTPAQSPRAGSPALAGPTATTDFNHRLQPSTATAYHQRLNQATSPTQAYEQLLRRTLGRYSTNVADDRAALQGEGLQPREYGAKREQTSQICHAPGPPTVACGAERGLAPPPPRLLRHPPAPDSGGSQFCGVRSRSRSSTGNSPP